VFTVKEDELAEAATETSSGIALAGSLSEDDSPSGKAVAVGAGKVNADGATIPASVALGDNVLYGKFAGSEVYIEGTKFKVVPASECLAKW